MHNTQSEKYVDMWEMDEAYECRDIYPGDIVRNDRGRFLIVSRNITVRDANGTRMHEGFCWKRLPD